MMRHSWIFRFRALGSGGPSICAAMWMSGVISAPEAIGFSVASLLISAGIAATWKW